VRVLLTGATGFIGAAVLGRLAQMHEVVTAGRTIPAGVRLHVPIADISGATDWAAALSGVDAVVHCAGLAHAKDDVRAHRAVNLDGTLRLARQAAEAGVRRFVFVSSIGVNGNESRSPFHADDAPNPRDAYAVSKHEAERALWLLRQEFPIELAIVRPPLVYGPGAPGNFGRLMRAIRRGVPLPFGAVDNKRSFVALHNLVDVIARCVEMPAAANQVFLVSDGEDLSTTDFLRRLAMAAGSPVRLLPVPVPMLEILGAITGRRELISKLCCNLQVDISKTRHLLEWQPQVSVDEGLRRAVSEDAMKTAS
jgi:nucleoside-diphosphate-sugar epimerase